MYLLQMSSKRPYMLRAFYDWLLDNQLTPHLVADVTLPGVNVPFEFAKDGQIILNIAPRAVGNLELGNDAVRFHARFGGVPHQVIVPMYAVTAIYARENGAGTMFEAEPAYDKEIVSQSNTQSESSLIEIDSQSMPFSIVSTEQPTEHADQQNKLTDDLEAPQRGRPSLRIVE